MTSRLSLQSRVTRLDSAVHHGGPRSHPVSMIIMHDTDGYSARSSIDYLNTTTEKSASYTYLIDRDGSILRMTDPDLIANHAGDSAWPNPVRATPSNPNKPNGGHSVNGISVGIAFASKEEPPTDEQRASALWLCAVLMEQHNQITIDRVRGHYEVSPVRKNDPAPHDMDDFRAMLREYLTVSA